MIQSIFWKWVFKKIWGLIKDANDDRMAKSHHKRIKSLDKYRTLWYSYPIRKH